MPRRLSRIPYADQSDEGQAVEQTLSEILRASPALIYVFNPKTMSNEYANRGIGEELGYTEDEIQAMGAALLPTIIHPEDMPQVMDHFERMVSLKDDEVAELEYRCRHKDGHWIWLSAREMVFGRDTDGSVARHIGLASDITLQKAAEDAARKEARQAAAANEDLRAFAYSVSHEMKSPSNTIAMILNEIDVQHSDDLPDDARYLLGLATDSINRMQKRINEVLGLTHFLVADDARTDVALDDVLANVLVDLAGEIDACQANVTVCPMPVLRTSETQMHTLFQNLIGNALKYRERGHSPTVTVWDDSTPEDSHITIVLRDDGIGVPEDCRDRIFEMFKRLHLPNEYDGNGLGLAICRRIVNNHDGELFVRAAPERGSDFVVRMKR